MEITLSGIFFLKQKLRAPISSISERNAGRIQGRIIQNSNWKEFNRTTREGASWINALCDRFAVFEVRDLFDYGKQVEKCQRSLRKPFSIIKVRLRSLPIDESYVAAWVGVEINHFCQSGQGMLRPEMCLRKVVEVWMLKSRATVGRAIEISKILSTTCLLITLFTINETVEIRFRDRFEYLMSTTITD